MLASAVLPEDRVGNMAIVLANVCEPYDALVDNEV
jgi:hypothetical protein